MGLKEDFDVAAEEAKSLPDNTSNEDKLQLYALFKQATVGDVNTDRPGIFDPKGRAKWDHWDKVKGKSKDEAMQAYIQLVADLKANGIARTQVFKMNFSMKNSCQIQNAAQRMAGSRRLTSFPVRQMRPTRVTSSITAFMQDDKTSATATSASTLSLTVSLQLSVAYGEHIKLVGAADAFGNWELGAAPELTWNEGDVWTVTLDLPAGFSSEYKFVHYIPGQAPVWEFCENRILTIPQSTASGPVSLDLTWCEPSPSSGEPESIFTSAPVATEVDYTLQDGVTPAFQSAVSSVAAFFNGTTSTEQEEKMFEQGSEDIAALEAAFEAEPALKEQEEEEKAEEETTIPSVEAAVEILNAEEDALAAELAKPNTNSTMLEKAAKTAGAVALGVAGAALLSALAIDVADTAIIGAVAAAAGGAVLSGSGASSTKSSRKNTEAGEEGVETEEETLSEERNITGAGETGVIIAAGLLSAFDAGRSMVESMTSSTSDARAGLEEEESTKMEEE